MNTRDMAFPKDKDIEKEPETIRIYADGRECLNLATPEGKAEYRRRVQLMLERQRGICCLYGHIPGCPGRLKPHLACFEHENLRGMGGALRDDRIVLPNGQWQNGAAHYQCNKLKGSQRIQYNNRDRERLP
jgi:hypothetical protein